MAEPPAVSYEGEILEPAHIERVSTPSGELYKLTCACHKRILSPLHSPNPIGRCPKCGRRLRLPGYRSKDHAHAAAPETESSPTKGEVPPVTERSREQAAAPAPAAPPAPELEPSHPEDEIGTIVMEPYAEEAAKSLPAPAAPAHATRDLNVGREAAIRTADLLRQHKVSGVQSPSPGLISAWPLAGRLPRFLAGFIDLTVSLVASGLIVALGSLHVLPANSLHPAVILAAFLTAQLLNDCLLQWRGGSLGKRLVVLTLRTHKGEVPGLGRILLRGVLKWLLFPGWILALIHPSQQALHDVACGTLVLKGRLR
jgi:uncharacterized RDD family membrane protein YckC